MQSGQQDPQRQEEEDREDDMTGGDLGYGLGMKPGGIYEKGVKPQNPDGLGLAPAARLRSVSFKWTAYTALHTVFQKRPGRWRLNSEVSPDVMCDLSNEELKQRLQEVAEEADILRSELEVTQRQLEGKCEALKILQSRAVFDKATTHTKTLLQKSEERNKLLEKEVNALQWEIAFNQVQFKNIEQSWKEKYQRVCSENETLTGALEVNASQLQELKLENSYLNQQHLELLAMLSVKEQKMFQESLPPSSGGVREGTALELAVLGACSCSVSGGEPCPCAKSAAASRTQVLQLKQELDTQREWKEEAFVMADAFRIAFEQQLKRRADQTLLLMEADPFLRKEPSRAKKVNGEAGTLTMGQKLKGILGSSADCEKLEAMDDPEEILQMLLDLLNDKEEALAHQRKVSYMLAHNAEKLEGHIKQMKGTNPLGNADSAGESGTNQRCHEPWSQHHCPGTRFHKPDEGLHNVRGEL
ncbi:coiled-coil domain-containing protein 125-like [Polyodon spathula]|uniref:coiled-coil domain-containing protein 125-like n=1 Tax=Polyodon spathula TaxID=7913 RepID=UPI001B7E87C6|nr:coiled-coil domain-containing protein 125-like [Polyodon spathula]